MSFDLLKTARRNIGVRLGLWYAFVFAVSSVALLTLAYYLLAAAVGSKDREVLEARLQEYAAVYENGGLPALRDAMQQEAGDPKTFFVRLVNPWNEATFVNVPEDWIAFKDIPGGFAGYRQRVSFLRIPKNAEKDFLIASMALPDNFAVAGGAQHGQPRGPAGTVAPGFHLFRQRDHSAGFSGRRVFCPSRHAAHPPGGGHRALHHSNRPARRPRARCASRTTNWMKWSACSTPCSTKTRR